MALPDEDPLGWQGNPTAGSSRNKTTEVPLQLEQMEVGLGTGMGHELGLKSGRKGIGVSYLLLRYI